MHKGYIVIPNALDLELSLRLKKHALNLPYKKAAISSGTEKHINPEIRRTKIFWMSKEQEIENEYLQLIDSLQEAFNRELFLCIKYYEGHFALYEKGDFYETHYDTFKNSQSRIVTTVYYLNDNWHKDDGGELVIYDEENNVLEKVLPEANTLVVFLSEKFPHEVLPAKKARYSIAGWFRINE